MRTLSALLALAAMTFSLAESVVASTCAPMSIMDDGRTMDAVTMMDASTTVDAASMSGDGVVTSEAAPGAMDCPFMAAHEGEAGEGGRHCPFGPAVGQGCAGAPSLPALILEVSPALAQLASGTSVDEVHPHLLLARVLFHPPRA